MIIEREPIVSLLLDAGHGEYMPRAPRAVVVFSAYEIWPDSEYSDEQAAHALRRALPAAADGFEVLDPSWCIVIHLRASRFVLHTGRRSLLDQVAVEPHGDDDTFDYWPSGCRLLMAMARDLDEIDPSVHRVAESTAAIENVLAAKPDFLVELHERVGLKS